MIGALIIRNTTTLGAVNHGFTITLGAAMLLWKPVVFHLHPPVRISVRIIMMITRTLAHARRLRSSSVN